MPSEIGTAHDLEDLFGKLVAFVSSNPKLVAAGQAWQVLRLHRDNLAALTTNLPERNSGRLRTMLHTCRYDARSLNINTRTSSQYAEVYTDAVVLGTSFIHMQLRQAREVSVLRLCAPFSGYNLARMLRSFRLQYSDDGSTWETALSVRNTAPFNLAEWRDFALPTAVGPRLHWRLIIDGLQSNTSSVSWSSMLLLSDDGSVANHFGSEVIFKAPGLAGEDAIYTGIRCEYAATEGWYNLFLNGYTGFDPNEPSWFEQPGALPGPGTPYPLAVPMVPCWNTLMPYWFAASGRSLRFGVKVATSYEGGYLGFILPYGSPNQYPYPLAVGGSLVPYESSRGAAWRYSYVNWRHGVFPGPGAELPPNSEGHSATLYLRTLDGQWRYFSNRSTSSPDAISGPSQSTSPPYAPSGAWRSVWPHCMNDQWHSGKLPYRECQGGGYMPQACILLQRMPAPQVFGELEGVYAISGYQNAAENPTVIDGKPTVVLQNAYRTTVHEFWALTLEEN